MSLDTMTQTPNATESNAVADGLNVTVANAIVFYQKLHHYHWRVTGEQFFDLHEKFEALYDKFAEVLDDVAERVLQIEAAPVKTLSEALSLATISEETDVPPAAEMASRTKADMMTIREQMLAVIETAEAAGDRTTANILDAYVDGLDKEIWMLRAYTS